MVNQAARTKPSRVRKSVLIDPTDQIRIAAALERWARAGDLVALRTRAFVSLLWDGALRTGQALALDIDEVVRDSDAARIEVAPEVMQRPRTRGGVARRFFISDRARSAIAQYLELARAGGWLFDPDELEGPLWISKRAAGRQQRLSQRTATHAWRTFIASVPDLSAPDYQLDDIVLTGRITFLKAAAGSPQSLAEHAGISALWAGRYRDHLGLPAHSAREVMSRLNDRALCARDDGEPRCR